MPIGRPLKVTPALVSQISEAFLYGFTDQEVATLVDINEKKTIRRMRRSVIFVRRLKEPRLHARIYTYDALQKVSGPIGGVLGLVP